MHVERICKYCGTRIKVYNSLQNKCAECSIKLYKPIPKKGRETLKYEAFREKVAKPYLDKRYGHVCSFRGCNITDGLEVDHIKTRGARHDLKFDVKNLQYLCFYHHRQKTDGKQ